MRIIALGHRRQTGKDTVAKLLQDELLSRLDFGRNVEIHSFAEPLYATLHYIFGWGGFETKAYYDAHPDKKEVPLKAGLLGTPRELLINFGQLMRKTYSDNFWIRNLLYTLGDRQIDVLIIPDMRFPVEFNAVKAQRGLCVKVERPGAREYDDEADTALAHCDLWDYTLRNDCDLDTLPKRVRDFTRVLV